MAKQTRPAISMPSGASLRKSLLNLEDLNAAIEVLSRLDAEELDTLLHDWLFWARSDQLPPDLAALLGIDWHMELPLFLVIFGGIVAGLLLGFVWEWFREMKHRSAASTRSREVTRLQRELAVLKDSTSVPPRDEVLALLDKR